MQYTQPEIRSFGLASMAIQSDTQKDDSLVADIPQGPRVATLAAYEADE